MPTVNIDRASAQQVVTIEFVRGQTPDENPDMTFLSQDHSDVTDVTEREKCLAQDKTRFAAYLIGDWHMRGLWVEARVLVPIGGGSFSIYTLRSPGLWGVESDCGAEYENAVWTEEASNLREALKAMAPAFAAIEV